MDGNRVITGQPSWPRGLICARRRRPDACTRSAYAIIVITLYGVSCTLYSFTYVFCVLFLPRKYTRTRKRGIFPVAHVYIVLSPVEDPRSAVAGSNGVPTRRVRTVACSTISPSDVTHRFQDQPFPPQKKKIYLLTVDNLSRKSKSMSNWLIQRWLNVGILTQSLKRTRGGFRWSAEPKSVFSELFYLK